MQRLPDDLDHLDALDAELRAEMPPDSSDPLAACRGIASGCLVTVACAAGLVWLLVYAGGL